MELWALVVSDVPKFNVTQVFKTRDKVFNQVFQPRQYDMLVGPRHIQQVVEDLQKALPGGIEFNTLFETVRPLVGKELTPKLCGEFAWRVAGNIQRLKDGLPVYSWSTQESEEWTILQVLRAVRNRNPRTDEVGITYDYRVLLGSPCPLVISRWWSQPQCSIAARALGFSAAWNKYPYTTGEQLVGLRLAVYLDPQYSRDKPGFKEIAPTNHCLQWNRDILRLRLRHEDCPNGWLHPWLRGMRWGDTPAYIRETSLRELWPRTVL
jgi:hypothetical protein